MVSLFDSSATALVLLECGAQVDILNDVRVHKGVNYVTMSTPALIINPWLMHEGSGSCFM